MAKKVSSKVSKKLEALMRSEQINRMLENSTIESEALQSAAGDSRPVDESHVLDLLGEQKAAAAQKMNRGASRAKKQPKQRSGAARPRQSKKRRR